ncbi:MAG: NfeD family protein [Actinomycetes bacterium]
MAALWIWLAIAAICVVAEVLTVNLIFFMIAAGAAAGAVADVAGLNGPLQIVVAAIVAAAGLLLVRPVLMRRFNPANPASATNVDALIGKLALTAETITDTSGTATINGETWSARVPVATDPIPAGERARIMRIDGVYLVLSPNPKDGGPQ